MADLEPDGHYVVRINSGALTDEAGNAFAGIGGNALDFETEQDDGDGDGEAMAMAMAIAMTMTTTMRICRV